MKDTTLISTLKDQEAFLQKLVEEGKFDIKYQPKISANPNSFGNVIGLEALISLGLNPNQVNGLMIHPKPIEETDFIISLGDKYLSSVFSQVSHLKEHYGVEIPISINLGALQLNSAKRIARGLDSSIIDLMNFFNSTYRISPELVTFELLPKRGESKVYTIEEKTELAKLSNMGYNLLVDGIEDLESSGLTEIIDQFSSCKVPWDALIDLKTSNPMLDNYIGLRNKHGLNLEFEGVDSKEQLGYLLRNLEFMNSGNKSGLVTSFQGHLFSEPIPFYDVPKIIETGLKANFQ